MTTREAYLFLLLVLIVVLLCIGFRLILSRIKPPYISDGDIKCDTFSVNSYSYAMRSLPWFYREYRFVKGKNGKYRMKWTAFDLMGVKDYIRKAVVKYLRSMRSFSRCSCAS